MSEQTPQIRVKVGADTMASDDVRLPGDTRFQYAWSLDPTTDTVVIDQAKKQPILRGLISAHAEGLLAAGIVVNGKNFKCDDQTILRLSSMAKQAREVEATGASWSQNFITSAGDEMLLSSSDQVEALVRIVIGYFVAVIAASAQLQENYSDVFDQATDWPLVPNLSSASLAQISSDLPTFFSGHVMMNSVTLGNGTTYSAANTLDDYEEGAWTPTLSGATTTTYTIQEGYYRKVGSLVTVQCKLIINAIGDGSATTLSGLPFTALNSTFASACGGNTVYWGSIVTAVTNMTPIANPNSASVNFSGVNAASTTAVGSLALFQNSARVDFSMTYIST